MRPIQAFFGSIPDRLAYSRFEARNLPALVNHFSSIKETAQSLLGNAKRICLIPTPSPKETTKHSRPSLEIRAQPKIPLSALSLPPSLGLNVLAHLSAGLSANFL